MVGIIVWVFEIALYIYYSVVTFKILEYPIGWKIVIILLMVFSANAISTVIHECGHLIGGVLSKHKLLSIQLGYIKLFRSKGSIYLAFTRWDNQCIMIPDETKPAFALYHFGGVLLNFIVSAVLCYVGYFHVRLGSLVFLFICTLITTGICKMAGNGIPIYKNTYPVNDMAYVKVLEKDRVTREEYYLYLKCLAAVSNGEDISSVERPCQITGKNYCDLFWRKILELQETNKS